MEDVKQATLEGLKSKSLVLADKHQPTGLSVVGVRCDCPLV